ncbi:MAG: hypothetical protein HYT21_00095 [Candidatus Nealsonbacteria bacterium]|nr:hypothetical protein [Candidatus Nealsonbacteria bacterium]
MEWNFKLPAVQGIVTIKSYDPLFKEQVAGLYRQGHPDSFDDYDLEYIGKFLDHFSEAENKFCFLAFVRNILVGASIVEKVFGPQDIWETSYAIVKGTARKLGIGRTLIGAQEECLRDITRISFVVNAGILPETVVSYPFWKSVGYEHWAVLPGYFRDDLAGIFLAKRNPYYRIGRGIPRDSRWSADIVDSLTGEKVSKRRYGEILRSLGPVSKEKWGLGLILGEKIP